MPKPTGTPWLDSLLGSFKHPRPGQGPVVSTPVLEAACTMPTRVRPELGWPFARPTTAAELAQTRISPPNCATIPCSRAMSGISSEGGGTVRAWAALATLLGYWPFEVDEHRTPGAT